MLEYFTPEDKGNDDNDYHKQATTQSHEPLDMADYKDFTLEEITSNANLMQQGNLLMYL